jgi:hypothetical protein
MAISNFLKKKNTDSLHIVLQITTVFQSECADIAALVVLSAYTKA